MIELAPSALARLAGVQGVSLFSYGVLFPKHKPNNLAQALRDGPFRQPARVPLPSRELPARELPARAK